ncbi:uncharacterized protein TNCV_4990601 [Trichonephila clavipes]|nr:uncharacterized protein TNCV_4990601 [Trichonephila clavipes]
MFTITVQNRFLQKQYMLDSVGEVVDVLLQGCRVFHGNVQQLRILEQRDPHFSQVESYKQDSSDVPLKSNRGLINREIEVTDGLVHHAQSIVSQMWHSGSYAHRRKNLLSDICRSRNCALYIRSAALPLPFARPYM